MRAGRSHYIALGIGRRGNPWGAAHGHQQSPSPRISGESPDKFFQR
jgi:hypothetical protein